MGGHIAKALSNSVDLIILDRTFSSISLIPRFDFGWIGQKVFDLVIDNYKINCRSLLETDSKKIILYDPKNDTVIKYLSSATFGVTVELANLFFNKSNRADIESCEPALINIELFRKYKNSKF